MFGLLVRVNHGLPATDRSGWTDARATEVDVGQQSPAASLYYYFIVWPLNGR
jgi:hypothetical protein